MKRTSLFLIIGVLCALFVSAYSAYVYWQISVANADLKLVQKSLSDVEATVLQNENQQVLQAVFAKQTVNDLKGEIVKWSEVIQKIRATIPQKNGFPLVEILSYSGSSGRDISMSVKTVPGSEDPYFDVADLIEAFNKEKDFVDPFVPSISAGNDVEGNASLSFSMNMKYQSDDDLQAGIGEILDQSIAR